MSQPPVESESSSEDQFEPIVIETKFVRKENAVWGMHHIVYDGSHIKFSFRVQQDQTLQIYSPATFAEYQKGPDHFSLLVMTITNYVGYYHGDADPEQLIGGPILVQLNAFSYLYIETHITPLQTFLADEEIDSFFYYESGDGDIQGLLFTNKDHIISVPWFYRVKIQDIKSDWTKVGVKTDIYGVWEAMSQIPENDVTYVFDQDATANLPGVGWDRSLTNSGEINRRSLSLRAKSARVKDLPWTDQMFTSAAVKSERNPPKDSAKKLHATKKQKVDTN